MKYNLHATKKFKKSLKKLQATNKDKLLIFQIIKDLTNNKTLDKKYKNHFLEGNYINCQECHIKPDLLLIYKIDEQNLYLVNIGSHAKLFK